MVSIVIDAANVKGMVSPGLFTQNHRVAQRGFGVLGEDGEIKADILEATRELGVTGLRFPGGTVGNNYDWRKGIGPDRSPGYEYGVMEHMKFVLELGEDALAFTQFVIGRQRSSIQEAADLVSFVNGSLDAEAENIRKWAALRSEYGHSKPYGVTWWVLGNEVTLPILNENNEIVARTPDEYLDGTKSFPGVIALRAAMKAIDPSIKVGLGYGDGYDDFIELLEALETRNEYFDFYDIHQIPQDSFARDTGFLTFDHYFGIRDATHAGRKLETYERVIDRYPSAKNRSVIVSTEFDAGSENYKRALHHGLANAVQLTQLVKLNTFWQSHSPFSSIEPNPFGAFQRYEFLRFSNDLSQWYITAPSWPYKLFANHLGRILVDCEIADVPIFEATPGTQNLNHHSFAPRHLKVSKLFAVAGMNGAGSELDLIVTNVGMETSEAISAEIQIEGFSPAPEASRLLYTGQSIVEENTFECPDNVFIEPLPDVSEVSKSFSYEFPARSVTAIRFYSIDV